MRLHVCVYAYTCELVFGSLWHMGSHFVNFAAAHRFLFSVHRPTTTARAPAINVHFIVSDTDCYVCRTAEQVQNKTIGARCHVHVRVLGSKCIVLTARDRQNNYFGCKF